MSGGIAVALRAEIRALENGLTVHLNDIAGEVVQLQAMVRQLESNSVAPTGYGATDSARNRQLHNIELTNDAA